MRQAGCRGAGVVRCRPGGESSSEIKEAREVEVGGKDHHAEQEDERVVIDCGVGLFRGEDPGADHEDGAEQGGGGPVEWEDLEAASADQQVREEEDQGGEQGVGHKWELGAGS